MPPELISILVQIPVVAVFIWYSERINRQFQEFLKEQRKEDREIITRLVNIMEQHDHKTDDAIATMRERTRPRKVE